MLLAIDIGNTHMRLGALNADNEVVTQLKMRTDLNETAHEYAAEIKQVLSLDAIDATSFDGVIISSVVPSVNQNISEAVRLLSGREPLILGSDIRIDLPLDMNGLTQGDIAGDLLATAIAARAYYRCPAIIIDIGTATTVTALSKEGAYIGGCILPGPNTALFALVNDTSLLPDVDYTAPDAAIAKDTVNAMRSGIVYGSAGALDGLLDRFVAEIGGDPVILATGGMADKIAPHCRHEVVIDQDLLMRGLGLVWEMNQSSREKV